MPKTPPTYYVRLDTFWQNSPDRWAGPFTSRDEAEQAIDDAARSKESLVVRLNQNPQDIKHAIRVYGVFPASQAIRRGMILPEMDIDRTNIIDRIPLDTDELFDIEQKMRVTHEG